MKIRRNTKGKDSGAIITEATIVLPTFIFAIFILLSVVDICYVQAKMGVALNSAAKEMSQYSYLYSVLNLDEYMSGSDGKSSEFIGSFSEVLSTISNGASDVSSATSSVSDEISDFSSYVSKMFSLASSASANDSAAEYAKDLLGSIIAKGLVQKNLVSFKGDTAESFLKRNHVVNGLSGLNFLYTSFLTNAEQNEVDLVVSYKIQVIKLLNIDFKFNFIQRAKTKAWGDGVKIGEESAPSRSNSSQSSNVWDSGALSRGKQIVAEEKKKNLIEINTVIPPLQTVIRHIMTARVCQNLFHKYI